MKLQHYILCQSKIITYLICADMHKACTKAVKWKVLSMMGFP